VSDDEDDSIETNPGEVEAEAASKAEPTAPLWQRLAYSRPPLWYRVAQLLLPPLLVSGAIGVHWWLNVPDKILESPRDQGAKKKKKKASRARKSRRDRKTAREQPRSAEQLADDWAIFAGGVFEDEPTRSSWARSHQALINRAMVVARREGFEGAPEKPSVVLTSTKCHTVRCRFVLRSPYRHELDVMVDSLERMQVDDATIWRSFQSESVTAPEGLPSAEQYMQITVGFRVDDTDSRSLALAKPEPKPESAEP